MTQELIRKLNLRQVEKCEENCSTCRYGEEDKCQFIKKKIPGLKNSEIEITDPENHRCDYFLLYKLPCSFQHFIHRKPILLKQ